MQTAEELRDLLCLQVYDKPFAELKAPDEYVLGDGEFAIPENNRSSLFLGPDLKVYAGREIMNLRPRLLLHPKPKPRTLTLDDGKGSVKTVEIPDGERVIAFVTDGPGRKVRFGGYFTHNYCTVGVWTDGDDSDIPYQPVRKLDLE